MKTRSCEGLQGLEDPSEGMALHLRRRLVVPGQHAVTMCKYTNFTMTSLANHLVEWAIAMHGMYESPYCVGNVHSLSYFQFQGIDGLYVSYKQCH